MDSTKNGLLICFVILLIFVVLGYPVYHAIDSRNTTSTLDGWQSLNIVENQKYTDCYGRTYTSLEKFLPTDWVYLSDGHIMDAKFIPVNHQYHVYKKSYFIQDYYLIVCVE